MIFFSFGVFFINYTNYSTWANFALGKNLPM